MRLYHKILSELPPSRKISEVILALTIHPSPRFWVTPERAAIVVSSMLKGEKNSTRNYDMRIRMYNEIFHKVKIVLRDNPDLSVYSAVHKVIYKPASSFFLSYHAMRKIVYTNIKKTSI